MRWRIAAPAVLLVVASLAALGLALGALLRERQVDLLQERLAHQAELATEAIAPLVDGPSEPLLQEARRQANLAAARVQVFDRAGMLLADSAADGQPVPVVEIPSDTRDALAGRAAAAERRDPASGLRELAVSAPLQRGGQTVGVARVAAPLLEIDQSVAQAALIVVAAALVAAAAMAMLAAWQSAMLLQPLNEVVTMARWIASGDLEHRVFLGRRGPLRELADALNTMADRVREQVGGLASDRNRLAAILAAMDDGVVIVDGEGTVALLNAAARRILRVPGGQGVGSPFARVVREHELVRDLQPVLAGASDERPPQIVQLSGRPPRYLRVLVTPLNDPSGRQALVVLQDITDLRRAELARQEFVANVSHELRTPLATLKALVETLEGGALDDQAAARDFLAKMHVEVDGLAQLVTELLELSKIESGQTPMRLEPQDAAALLRAAADRLRPHADRAGLALVIDAPSDLPPVAADPARVQQALINLLHNAIKFTPPGGRIELRAERAGEALRLSVRDTGVGIDPEDLPRIFERFYKADRARAGVGTGLGLAIVKHIVQAHGGEVQAESSPGQGSTFSFTLPLWRAPAAVAPA